MPSLFGMSAVRTPGVSLRSIMNAVMPRWPADGSVFAKQRAWSATDA